MQPGFNDAEQDDSPKLPANSPYPTLLGMLIYVLRTRPDIAYAVNRLATRSSIATEKDLLAIQQVIAYLRTTRHLELVYNSTCPRQRKTITRLQAWSDAAYLTHRDSRSHSGVCFSLGDLSGAFHSRSSRHAPMLSKRGKQLNPLGAMLINNVDNRAKIDRGPKYSERKLFALLLGAAIQRWCINQIH